MCLTPDYLCKSLGKCFSLDIELVTDYDESPVYLDLNFANPILKYTSAQHTYAKIYLLY